MQNCSKHGLVRYVKSKASTSYRCTKCRCEAVQRARLRLKQRAVEYKGGKCSNCGYNKCISALDFHHVDPTTKEFHAGMAGKLRSWDKLKVELDKCILLCANCHREIHSQEHDVQRLEKRVLRTKTTDITKEDFAAIYYAKTHIETAKHFSLSKSMVRKLVIRFGLDRKSTMGL